VEKEIDDHDTDQSREDNRYLIGCDAHIQNSPAPPDLKPISPEFRTPEELGSIAEKKGKTQCGNEKGKAIGLTEGFEGKTVHAHSQQNGKREGRDEGNREGEMKRLFHKKIKGIGSPHDQFPMGEVNEVQDSVDQCQPHGEKGIDTAGQ